MFESIIKNIYTLKSAEKKVFWLFTEKSMKNGKIKG